MLEMTCTITGRKGPLVMGEGKALVGGKTAAVAEMTFALVDGN